MTRARRRRLARRGMTLIEVMVAMTIIAIVATLLYTGFTQTASNKRRVESEMERHHEIRMGLERMARELSMAFVSAQLNINEALQVVKTAFVGKEASGGSRIDFTHGVFLTPEAKQQHEAGWMGCFRMLGRVLDE